MLAEIPLIPARIIKKFQKNVSLDDDSSSSSFAGLSLLTAWQVDSIVLSCLLSLMSSPQLVAHGVSQRLRTAAPSVHFSHPTFTPPSPHPQ